MIGGDSRKMNVYIIKMPLQTCPKICDINSVNKNSTLVDTSCRPRVNIAPFSQIIGIELMKIKATKRLTQKIVKHISQKHCAAWREQSSRVARKSIRQFIKNFAVDWRKASKCQGLSLVDCSRQYKSLNSFFGRSIYPKPSTSISSSNIIVSPAQCRMVAFDTVTHAKKIWVKSQQFSVRKLLDDSCEPTAYNNCSMAIFRLAPADYHRFHSPVEGTILKHHIVNDGTYYSVDPKIVNSSIDVLGENKREILYIKTKYFGIVAFVIVGATCVGSIKLSKNSKIHGEVKLVDYLGKFAFGGSTIVMLLPSGKATFCPIYLNNSKRKTETLVDVGDPVAKFTKT